MLEIGASLSGGRFELEALLGAGGMASVFRAKDRENETTRAVKVLDPDLAVQESIRKRFEAEADTMARLQHPNVVKVHEVVNDGKYLFLVMDLIPGPSVLDMIEDGPLDAIRALEITADILSALSAAHANGIIHRDIKPHNVLVDPKGKALVTDFGIARVTGHTDQSMTRTGTVMGTWAFMPPEQRTDAKGVEPASDIYGTGATLYAMLSGLTPPDLHACDNDPTILECIPAGLRNLVRQSTRYWAWERYTSVRAMRDDVQRILARIAAEDSADGEALRFQDSLAGSATPRPPRPPPQPEPGAGPKPPPSRAEPVPIQPSRPRTGQVQDTPRNGHPWAKTGILITLVLLIGVVWRAIGEGTAPDPDATTPVPAAVTTTAKTPTAVPRKYQGAPALQHNAPPGFSPDEDVAISVQVLGSEAYDKVVVSYKGLGETSYREATLRRTKDGYKGSIPMDRTLGEGLDYHIEARPYAQGIPVLRFASPGLPKRLFPR